MIDIVYQIGDISIYNNTHGFGTVSVSVKRSDSDYHCYTIIIDTSSPSDELHQMNTTIYEDLKIRYE